MFESLRPGSHIHLMGICGTAMASLAGILKGLGYQITGSDQNVYPPMSTQLEKLGIPIKSGYVKANLTPRPDAVIVGNVMTRKHEEVQALLETDIPYTSLPKAMGEVVIGSRKSIVIAGTHGKTTTTSLMAWIATQVGTKPGFLIGGIPLNFGSSFQMAGGDFFVIEGDEYDTAFFDKVPKFNYYKPRFVVLTSIEFDHADIYKDLEAVKSAFRELLTRIPEDGILLYQADDKNISEILRICRAKRMISYRVAGLEISSQAARREAAEGTPEMAGYTGEILGATAVSTKMAVFRKSERLFEVEIPMFGNYNLENALADIALAQELGWSQEKILEACRTFRGVKRRQEVIGEKNGITVIDDFAHHPTALRVTVEAVQNRFKGRRVISVFEPRSATSRRKYFEKDYEDAFGICQKLILSDVFNKGVLNADEVLDLVGIVSRLQSRGRDVLICGGPEEILKQILQEAQRGDVILIMSNGGFGGLQHNLVQAL